MVVGSADVEGQTGPAIAGERLAPLPRRAADRTRPVRNGLPLPGEADRHWRTWKNKAFAPACGMAIFSECGGTAVGDNLAAASSRGHSIVPARRQPAKATCIAVPCLWHFFCSICAGIRCERMIF